MTKFDSLKPTEKEIMELIMAWLRLKRIWCVHIYGTSSYRAAVRQAGVPDIIGCLPYTGIALFIEVKDHKGKVTTEQEAFLAARRKEGAIAFVARSLEDVESELIGFYK